jgi:hypothetical protein
MERWQLKLQRAIPETTRSIRLSWDRLDRMDMTRVHAGNRITLLCVQQHASAQQGTVADNYCEFFVSTRGPSAVGILTQQQQQAGYGKRLGSRQNPSVEDNDDNDDDYYYTHRAGAHSLRLSSTGETCQAFPSRHWMSASSGAAWGSDEETSF